MNRLRIQLDTIQGNNIARSKAREVLRDAERFRVIIIDYEHISEIGQAFADEIYRVFQNKHPDIVIQEENMSEGIRFMIERAKTEAKIKR